MLLKRHYSNALALSQSRWHSFQLLQAAIVLWPAPALKEVGAGRLQAGDGANQHT